MLNISTVLVTGANRGIGLEFVRQLAKHEPKIAHVFGTCRDPEKAEALNALASSHDNVHVLQLEVRNYEGLDHLYAEVEKTVGDSGLDLLINNAGIMIPTPFNKITPSEFLENFEVNSVAPFILTRKLLPLIKASQRKLIVNISSTLGSIKSATAWMGGILAYRTSKASLNMINKVIADEVAKDDIISVVICPGWVQTDMGGADAALTPEISVSNSLKNMANFNKESSGKFFNNQGKEVDW